MLASPAPARAHGAFHERIARANEALVEDPTSARLHIRRAEIYRRHRDFPEARADLARAAALEPSLPELDYYRGLLLLDAGEPAAAEEALDRFLAAEPDHASAHATRARARRELGNPLGAAADWSSAIAHQPVPVPELYLARAQALAAAGDDHLDEAVRGLDEGMAALGPVVSLETTAIDLEVRRGNVDGALARVDRASSRARRKAHWLARRGEILEGAGRLPEARAAYRGALAEMDEIPAHRRHTPAARKLETQVREAMARVTPLEAARQ